MEQIHGDLHGQISFIYLHDVIIFAATYEEHIRRIELVLTRLEQAGATRRKRRTNSNMQWIWGRDQVDAFQEFRKRLITARVLDFPDFQSCS